MNFKEIIDASPNQPWYIYKTPMFMLNVSVVVMYENIIYMVPSTTYGIYEDSYKFPGGSIKAGQETIQFSAVRHVKEQTGIRLYKDLLMPIDFQSDPSMSPEGNVVDIGMLCMLEKNPENMIFDNEGKYNVAFIEVDFEKKDVLRKGIQIHENSQMLLKRAIEVSIIVQ